MSNRYTYSDLLQEVRVANNLLEMAGVDLAYFAYHSNTYLYMEHGTREKIKRWSGTIPFPHGSPSELKFRMYEHMAHFLLNHMIAQEENK